MWRIDLLKVNTKDFKRTALKLYARVNTFKWLDLLYNSLWYLLSLALHPLFAIVWFCLDLVALISVWLNFLTTFKIILSRCWLGDIFAGHLAAFPWLRFLGDTLKLAFPCILMSQGMAHLIISHLNPRAEFLKVVLFLPTIIKKLP